MSQISIGVRPRTGKLSKMLVGLLMISVIIGAVAGGAAIAFGNGLLVAFVAYSFTASTVLFLLALRHYAHCQEREQEQKRLKSTYRVFRAHSG
jgi:fatty acid desaturase